MAAIDAKDIGQVMAPFRQGAISDGVDLYDSLRADYLSTFERYADLNFIVGDISFRAWGSQVISMLRYTLIGREIATDETDTVKHTLLWLWEEGDEGWQVVDSASLPEEYTWEGLD
jgi:hypothetical protein